MVVFRTRSPDGRHTVEIVDAHGSQLLRVDGIAGRPFLGVGDHDLAFAGDHVAYAAREPRGWVVVQDGRPGPIFDAILDRSLRWNASGDRLAYAATRGPATFVVEATGATDHIGPPADGISLLRFSDDGTHLAYLARRGDQVTPVLDGRELRLYSAVAEFALDAHATHYALVVRRDRRWAAVIDGVEGPPFDRVSELVFSPDGAHLAYSVRRGRDEWVFRDSISGAAYERITQGTLHFSPDGTHLAYVAKRGGHAYAVLDGSESPAAAAIDALGFSPDGHLAWAEHATGGDRVVVDGQPGKTYPRVRDLLIARGGRVIYIAAQGETDLLVDGAKEIPFDLILEKSLALDEAGQRIACVAGSRRERTLFLVVDGKRGALLRFAALSDEAAIHAQVAQALATAPGAR